MNRINNYKAHEQISLNDDGTLEAFYRFADNPLDNMTQTYFSPHTDIVTYTKYEEKTGKSLLYYEFDSKNKYMCTIQQCNPADGTQLQYFEFNPNGTVERIIT